MPLAYSLVIPLYNEAESLRPLWAQITPVMKRLGKDWEAVFINDGSTDGSDAVLAELAAANKNIKVISFPRNRQKAAALQEAFRIVGGEIVITLDADLQDDPAEFPRLIDRLNEGYDLVVGYKKDRHDPFHKTIPSRFFNAMIRKMSGLGIHDINCGLKAYRRETLENLHIYGELYRFIPVLIASQGFRVTELAVHHRPRLYGKSKYGFSRFLRGFLDLFTVMFLTKFIKRPLHLFGPLGLLLCLVGILISLTMTYDHFALHEIVGRRPLLFFGILFIIAGIQLISTGLIAELVTYYSHRRERQ
jgi:glycosyltransferase involved in cell wall biosynthesis